MLDLLLIPDSLFFVPRQARIDFPGALHHVMARGIERRQIFADDEDRAAFLERLAFALQRTSTPCYAWSLMPNHFHLLLATGKRPVGRVLHSALFRYASYFNRAHRRSGHLFQNRYKSVLCERDLYFRELVRYIHLNPVRARLVSDMRGLGRYPWSGHAVLTGEREAPWQDTATVLSLFDEREGAARRAYRQFVQDGFRQGRRPELTGGGLRRSLGGWRGVFAARREGRPEPGDERILGSGAFVTEVLKAAEEELDRRRRRRLEGWKPREVLERAAKETGADVERLVAGRRTAAESRARRLASFWLVEELGMKVVEVARLLGVTSSAVSLGIARLQAAGPVPALERGAGSAAPAGVP